MVGAFNAVKEKLMATCPQAGRLSVKLIVHYGSIALYSVRGFAKLYGKAVVEAHRLMKNTVDRDSYTLITDAYMQAATKCPPESRPEDTSVSQCEVYGDVGKLCYTFFAN